MRRPGFCPLYYRLWLLQQWVWGGMTWLGSATIPFDFFCFDLHYEKWCGMGVGVSSGCDTRSNSVLHVLQPICILSLYILAIITGTELGHCMGWCTRAVQGLGRKEYCTGLASSTVGVCYLFNPDLFDYCVALHRDRLLLRSTDLLVFFCYPETIRYSIIHVQDATVCTDRTCDAELSA